jgi:hypothetical protein
MTYGILALSKQKRKAALLVVKAAGCSPVDR